MCLVVLLYKEFTLFNYAYLLVKTIICSREVSAKNKKSDMSNLFKNHVLIMIFIIYNNDKTRFAFKREMSH